VGPDYCCPEPCVLEEWSDTPAQSVAESAAEDAAWWEHFDDPLLAELVETALRQNLTLAGALERVCVAQAELGIASGMRYPQLQRIFYHHLRGRLSENVPPLSILPDDIKNRGNKINDLYTVSFDVAWELDLWGRFQYGIEAACADLWAAWSEYESAAVILAGEVAKTYVGLRTIESLGAILLQNIEDQQRLLQITEVRQRNQVNTEVDFQQAKAQLHTLQSQWEPLVASRAQARNALCVLLGLLPNQLDDVLDLKMPVPALTERIGRGLPCELIRRRPDIRAAEYRLMAACSRVGIAQTALYPHFGLVGTLGYSSTQGSSLISGNSFYWKYGPVLDWDILNYGRLENAVKAEQAHFGELLYSYEQTVLEAQQEVEDSVHALVGAEEEFTQLGNAVEAGRRAVDLLKLKYREGEIAYALVLQAQQQLLNQEQQEVEAAARQAVSAISLYKALGGGWQSAYEECEEEI
jgi:NodT family efflux transporter outer membrane factor (OMF) lipoprotein